MISPKLKNTCVLMAAALILPNLSYAREDHDKGYGGRSNGHQDDRGHVYKVPEGSPGIVMLTATFGVMLLVSTASSRGRAKAARVES